LITYWLQSLNIIVIFKHLKSWYHSLIQSWEMAINLGSKRSKICSNSAAPQKLSFTNSRTVWIAHQAFAIPSRVTVVDSSILLVIRFTYLTFFEIFRIISACMIHFYVCNGEYGFGWSIATHLGRRRSHSWMLTCAAVHESLLDHLWGIKL
jgi:hypothetical protein